MIATLTTAEHTGLDLTTLATRINHEHQAAQEAAQTAVEHARRCGELLIEAKAQVGHGAFLPWLEANCEVSTRQAQNYMRLADNWPAIEAKYAPGAHLTIKGALRLLSEEKPAPPPADRGADLGYRRLRDTSIERRSEMCANWPDLQAQYVVLLDAAGWPADEIASYLGIDEAADVLPMLDPNPPPRSQADLSVPFPNVSAADYRNWVQHFIRFWQWQAAEGASWRAGYEGFPEVTTHLAAAARSHKRAYDRLPFVHRGEFQNDKAQQMIAYCVVRDARVGFGIEKDQSSLFLTGLVVEALHAVDEANQRTMTA